MVRLAHVLVLLASLLLFLLLQSSPPAAAAGPAAAGPAAAGPAAPPDIVDETCKEVASDSSNGNYTLCVESLRSVHRSSRADLRGLAVISLRLAKVNATHAKSLAKALLRSASARGSSKEKSCLELCREMYDYAASDLKTAARMVKAKLQNDAMTYTSSALTASVTCDDGFEEGGIASPIAEENRLLQELTTIALGITSRLG